MLLSKATYDLSDNSGYKFFVSMCVPWELNPQPFALLTQCSTTERQEHFYGIKAPCRWRADLRYSVGYLHRELQRSCRGATNIDSTFWFGDATSNPSLVRGGLNSAESTRELSAESDQGITTGFTRVEPLVELSI